MYSSSRSATTHIFSRHGLSSWLSKRMRMVSLPTRGTSLRFTASWATKRTVQRARPSGGVLHTMAITLFLAIVQYRHGAGPLFFVYSRLQGLLVTMADFTDGVRS